MNSRRSSLSLSLSLSLCVCVSLSVYIYIYATRCDNRNYSIHPYVDLEHDESYVHADECVYVCICVGRYDIYMSGERIIYTYVHQIAENCAMLQHSEQQRVQLSGFRLAPLRCRCCRLPALLACCTA